MSRIRKFAFVAAILAVADGVGRAEVSNGTFDSDLTSWTSHGTAQVVTAGSNKLVALKEPADGSRGRVYQEVTAPSTPTWLSFRYRFAFGPDTRPASLPPDSFAAYLIDGNGNRVVIPGGNDPSFCKAFFYTDSDGKSLFDSSLVSITSIPDPEGMHTVTLDISGLNNPSPPTGPLRVEFGLDAASNGVKSFALVDDVRLDLPVVQCVFQDNFNRPDSFTVGNGWTEHEDQGPPVMVESVKIKLNALSLSDDHDTAPNDLEEAWAAQYSLDVSNLDAVYIRVGWSPQERSDNDKFFVEWADSFDWVWIPAREFDLSSEGTVGRFETFKLDLPNPLLDNEDNPVDSMHLRLRTETSQPYEGVYVDFVEVCGQASTP